MSLFETLTALAALGSTLVAAVAAYFSYRSANSSLLAYEAGIIRDHVKTYSSDEFLAHLRALRAWLDARAADPSLDFIALLSAREERAVRTDAARRAVKFYFDSVARLGRAKYLRSRAVREICSQAGIDLYFEAAIPLTQQINPEMDLAAHNYLQRMRFRRQRAIRSVA